MAPPHWEVLLRLESIGYGPIFQRPSVPKIVAEGARIELREPLWTEWFVNDSSGIEHGFTLARPLPGRSSGGPLEVRLRVGGTLTPSLGKDGISFVQAGRTVLHYGALRVVDSLKRSIPARFDLTDNLLRILVDDAGALYPLVIDPLTTNPVWATTGEQIDAEYSISLGSGDFNNDGYDDVVVGADEYTNDLVSEGRVYVFYGSSTGLNTVADWIAEGDQVGADFGISVSNAGDVNNDGYDDLIVGAHRFDNGEANEGMAFVFYGSATGLDANGTRPTGGPGTADWVAEGDDPGAGFGVSVDGAGDVNNDGYDDVIIGADEFRNGQTAEGAAFVYHGSSTGLDQGGARPFGNPLNADWFAESNRVDSDFGFSVAGAGNVNGDAYDDIVVGAWNWDEAFLDEGRVFVYHGSATGIETDPALILEGGQDDSRFGISVASAGDVDGDGFADILVGANDFNNGESDEGAAYLFPGSAMGTANVPAWRVESNQGNSDFGFDLASAGDVNGDGFSDVLVGAPKFDNVELEEGRAFLYLGSPSGLQETPIWTFESDQPGAGVGNTVSGAGDFDGDGFDDVVIGADEFDLLFLDEGTAYAFTGCSDLDRDGVCLGVDICPDVPNPDQEDLDGDGIGNECDPCTDADLDGACDGELVLVDFNGPGEQVLVEFGSTMKYLDNQTDPFPLPALPLVWVDPLFDDTPWADGTYGIGYEANTGAESLVPTTVPQGTFSVYTRAPFNIPVASSVENMVLGVDYDDAFVAWVNGVEVFRSAEMPLGDPLWNANPSGHESSNLTQPAYGILVDVSVAALPVLVDGANVLAIGVWNSFAMQSSDLVLVPRLSINRPAENQMTYLANTANPFIGTTWTDPSYDDSSWTAGNFGVGFDTEGQADVLIVSEVPTNARSVYARVPFFVSLSTAGTVFLDAEYDDGYIAWINGVEVYRSPEMPPAVAAEWNTPLIGTHESSNQNPPLFGSRVDISAAAIPVLVDGDNLLAVSVWTVTTAPDNADMLLIPKLSIGGVPVDNCPGLSNPLQLDTDMDGEGNDCDDDDDGDGFLDGADNCQLIANPSQLDTNMDMEGDACDPDDDGDSVLDDDDNCRLDVNPLQEDNEMDGIGDVCDPDDDNDSIPDGMDNCPFDANRLQEDNEPDGIGDVCDPDDDNDTLADGADNCPFDSNLNQDNMDGDAAGDLCDCLINDNTAWLVPSVITTLMLGDGATTPLTWQAPVEPGANVVDYDTMRVQTAGNFLAPTCLEANGVDTMTDETGSPVAGTVFFYLIRTDNLCAGMGTVGPDSAGMDRVTGACP